MNIVEQLAAKVSHFPSEVGGDHNRAQSSVNIGLKFPSRCLLTCYLYPLGYVCVWGGVFVIEEFCLQVDKKINYKRFRFKSKSKLFHTLC